MVENKLGSNNLQKLKMDDERMTVITVFLDMVWWSFFLCGDLVEIVGLKLVF